MHRSMLLAFAVYCSTCSVTNADDFLLRVDTIGYIDKPASEKDPQETILRSIEVVAHPESAFYSKVKTGTQTLAVKGKLRSADSGGFNLQIRYVCSIETGIGVPTNDGGWESVPDATEIQTNITIALGESVMLGGFETKESGSGKPECHSKTRCVVVLARYEPTDD